MEESKNVLENVEEQKAPEKEANVQEKATYEVPETKKDDQKPTEKNTPVAPQNDVDKSEKVDDTKNKQQSNQKSKNKQPEQKVPVKETNVQEKAPEQPVKEVPKDEIKETPKVTPSIRVEKNDTVLKRGTYTLTVGRPQITDAGCNEIINTFKKRVPNTNVTLSVIPYGNQSIVVIPNIKLYQDALQLRKIILGKGMIASIHTTEYVYQTVMR